MTTHTDLIARLRAYPTADSLLAANALEAQDTTITALRAELDEWRNGERQYPPSVEDYKELTIRFKAAQFDLAAAQADNARLREALKDALKAERERIAACVSTQRNDIPATGEEFAAAIRGLA